MDKQTPEQIIISKSLVLYATDEPAHPYEDVQYVYRASRLNDREVFDIARNYDQESVFLVESSDGEMLIKPARWILKKGDVVRGVASVSKADIIAAHNRKAISPAIRKTAVKALTAMMQDSYSIK